MAIMIINNNLFFGIFLVIVLISSIGHCKLSKKIIGGERTMDEDSHGWLVSVQNLDGHVCSGNIISPTHILTAAHCVLLNDRIIETSISIKSGINYLDDPTSQLFEAIIIIVHPFYRDEMFWRNDLAIITIADPIFFSNTQHNIALPADDFQLKKHFSTMFYGWGAFDIDDEIFDESPYLQKISLTYNDNNGCEAIFLDIKALMCMTMLTNKQGPSLGDSGGGLIVDDVIIAISSSNFKNDETNQSIPIFTNIYPYMNWIKETIKRY